jgi:hypothetical protein
VTATRRTRYTREILTAAVATSTNLREVLDQLGVPRTGGSHAHIARRIKALGIDSSHFTSRRAEPAPLPVMAGAELASAFAQARSMADLARRLGLPATARTRKHLTRQLAGHQLDVTKLGHRRLTLDEDALRHASMECTSLIGVIRALGLEESNSNVRRVRRALDVYAVDTTHFVRRPWRDPDPRPSRLTSPSRLLCRRKAGSARVGGERLRRALIATGVAEKCAECGLGGQWRNKPLSLEVDHVNGDWYDNRPRNLRLLCPNCHATTPTYCRKKSSLP